ncbi:unnamed protein product [Mucor hiemalis]
MKFFSYSAVILIATLLLSFVMTAPLIDDSTKNTTLPSASISITNSTTTPLTTAASNPAPAKTLADVMSGTTATASISLTGQNNTAQNSGDHTTASFAVLPLAIISALFLI